MGQATGDGDRPRWRGRCRAAVGDVRFGGSGRFPWPVLVVNVTGSLILGVLLAEESSHSRLRLLLHDAGGIGFCGSLTTFSTFSVEVVDLARHGDHGTAALYAVASLATTVAAVVVGAAALRRLRALALRLEERP